MSEKTKNLLTRTVSAAVLAVVVVGATLFSRWSFLALMMIISVGVMYEFFRISKTKGDIFPQTIFAIFVGVLIILEAFLRNSYSSVLILLGFVPIFFIVELWRKKERPIENVAVSIMGVLYGALPMVFLVLLAHIGVEYNPYIVLMIIFTVWVNDVFAYLIGIMMGKHRLFERISPKKSWEGFFGGLIFAVAFAALVGHYLFPKLKIVLMDGDIWKWIGLGVVIVVSAVFGDLVESMFKRSVGVKDSGNIMPGHGGFMDRFDALLISAPFVYLYFLIINP